MLAVADVNMGGERAASVSIQLIQDNGLGPAVPASCSAQGTVEDSQALLGANGILGVGLFLQDCGAYCASTADAIYFVCASDTQCSPAPIPLALQVANPAAFFAQDNNGVILQLPAIGANGAAAVDGNMIFGIGTQSNNGLAAATIGVSDGAFSVVYRGRTLSNTVLRWLFQSANPRVTLNCSCACPP